MNTGHGYYSSVFLVNPSTHVIPSVITRKKRERFQFSVSTRLNRFICNKHRLKLWQFLLKNVLVSLDDKVLDHHYCNSSRGGKWYDLILLLVLVLFLILVLHLVLVFVFVLVLVLVLVFCSCFCSYSRCLFCSCSCCCCWWWCVGCGCCCWWWWWR